MGSDKHFIYVIDSLVEYVVAVAMATTSHHQHIIEFILIRFGQCTHKREVSRPAAAAATTLVIHLEFTIEFKFRPRDFVFSFSN